MTKRRRFRLKEYEVHNPVGPVRTDKATGLPVFGVKYEFIPNDWSPKVCRIYFLGKTWDMDLAGMGFFVGCEAAAKKMVEMAAFFNECDADPQRFLREYEAH